MDSASFFVDNFNSYATGNFNKNFLKTHFSVSSHLASTLCSRLKFPWLPDWGSKKTFSGI
jgi:hypothetical protein